jgi:hypothetical protein
MRINFSPFPSHPSMYWRISTSSLILLRSPLPYLPASSAHFFFVSFFLFLIFPIFFLHF